MTTFQHFNVDSSTDIVRGDFLSAKGPFTWTGDAITEFQQIVDDLAGNTPKGVIFMMGHHAGANLDEIAGATSADEMRPMLDGLHKAFDAVAALECPVVAACLTGLGGGYELMLACTARIAQDGRGKIGLPEVLVGLYPGAGGTQRLPRLIGVMDPTKGAFALILQGKALSPKKALDAKLIDVLVDSDGDLAAEATKLLLSIIDETAELDRPEHDFSGIDNIAEMATQMTLQKTRGVELPNLMAAIEVIRDGAKGSLEDGLALEKAKFIEVALTDEAKGSINTFNLKTASDRPTKLIPADANVGEINDVGMVGFGSMGQGIVETYICNGFPVVVIDEIDGKINTAQIEKGLAAIRKNLEKLAGKGYLRGEVDEVMKRITVAKSHSDFADVDLVVEAVFERLDVKHGVYKWICETIGSEVPIATNTSSISVAELVKGVTNPKRFLGLHYFNPVPKMEVVEVVYGEATADDIVYTLLAFCAATRKRPIVCKDNPGFVVNALLLPYMLVAFKLAEQGVPLEAIDNAMVAFGFPVGPFRLMDNVGIDVVFDAMSNVGQPVTLKAWDDDGRKGFKKCGKGILNADGFDPEALVLVACEEAIEMDAEDIQAKLFNVMVIQGQKLLEAGIVDSADAIDTGMIWGTGFPAFKGGPMFWAKQTGVAA